MPAATAAQATEVAQATGIPILVLVTGFISALLILTGWVLSLERRKMDKSAYEDQRKEDRKDFESYSSKLESRLQAMMTDVTNRIITLYGIVDKQRTEILSELRDIREALRWDGKDRRRSDK